MFTLNKTSARRELSFSWSSEATFQTEVLAASSHEGENKAFGLDDLLRIRTGG